MPGTINFKEAMEARKQAQQAEAEKAKSEAPVAYVAPAATLAVRAFTEQGVARVTDLLRKMRIDGAVHQDAVDELVKDNQYAKPLEDVVKINPDKVFATKLELCEYFTKVFTPDFLVEHRRDKGLWTWLAMVYFRQFVKTKNNIAKIASDARWIYQPRSLMVWRRHFIAGNVYLYLDFKHIGKELQEMFFEAGPLVQFNAITDDLTHVSEVYQAPAVLQVAVWLYYDPASKSKIKFGTTGSGGSARRLTTVVQQLALTWDFKDTSSASELWNKLPSEFAKYKGENKHVK